MADEEDAKGSAKGAEEAQAEAKTAEKSAEKAPEAEAKPEKPAARPSKKPATSPWPSSHKSEAPKAAAAVLVEPGGPAAWGKPLARFDSAWSRLESRLCAWVLIAEIFSLVLWISLKGLSAAPVAGDVSGLVYRSFLGAAVLGLAAHFLLRRSKQHDALVLVAVISGLLLGKVWAAAGVGYFSNLLNWMQNASTLTLVGGVSNVAKRLTLWLALLGASIATAQGKHINVDVAMRFLSPRARMPVAVLGWLASALVCGAGAVGFVDHIAIVNYRASASVGCPGDALKLCDSSAGSKAAIVEQELGRDLFLARRQLALDLKSFPKVLSGQRYDQYLRPAEWNAWMNDGDWAAHWKADEVKALMMPEGEPDTVRSPMVSIPGGGESAQELLIRELNFVFPFGLLMIALRFVLRSLLAISGHVKVDPNAAHADDEARDVHKAGAEPPPDPEKEVA